MLEDGVAERIKTLLRSDMPPVQFKLLGTLRMLVDGQGDCHVTSYTHKYGRFLIATIYS